MSGSADVNSRWSPYMGTPLLYSSQMKRLREVADSPAIIFIAAAATRLGAALYICRNYFRPDLLFVQNEPSHIATALVSGFGFSAPYAGVPVAPTAQQPPAYPVLLAGIFKILGANTIAAADAIIALNILAGAVTAVLIHRLGRLYFSETVGTIGAWLWVLPWMYEAQAFSASCSSPCLAAGGFAALLLGLPRVIEHDRAWTRLGVGCGVMVLLQPSFLAVFVAYGICLGFRKVSPARISMAIFGLGLMLTPWLVRDYLDFGRIVPIRDNFGLELWLGNRPGMHGTVDYSGDFPDHDPTDYGRMGEIAFMDSKLNEAKSYIASDPQAFLERCLGRVVEFWCIPYRGAWILTAILGWIGAALAWRAHRYGWILVAPLVVYPPVFYLTHMFVNYRHPIDPVIVLLAAYAIVELNAHRKRLGMAFGA